MSAKGSKTEIIFDDLRLALQNGHCAPGDRVDPEAVAKRCHTSLTPARRALDRLLGGDLLEDLGRNGYRIPVPTEADLKDLYHWMEFLLIHVCQSECVRTAPIDRLDHIGKCDGHIAMTCRLFASMAASTESATLIQAVRTANAKLGPIRREEQHLLQNLHEELDGLMTLWEAGKLDQLSAAISRYHERRRRIAAQVLLFLRAGHLLQPTLKELLRL